MIKTHLFPSTIEILNLGDVHYGHPTCNLLALHACTGHYLDYDETSSYAASKLLEPAPLGSTIITLSGAKSSQSKHFSARFWTP